MGELAKIENICELNKTSLVFKREVTKEEWQQVFTTLQQVEGCVQFWIGDCLAYREQRWGMYEGINGMTPELKKMIDEAPTEIKRSMILEILEDNTPEHRIIATAIQKLIKRGVLGESSHIKEVVKMLREYVKVSDVEIKKYGEIMTPIELVEEMLDTLPATVWMSPNLKWLDPCNGVGTFISVVVQRLMKGLEWTIPNEEERYKHIMEEMIYVCELQPKNVFLYMYAFDPENKYAMNIYNGSFLSDGFNKHMSLLGVDKFDVIVMNPPYNNGSSNKSNVLWDKFVFKTIDNLNDGGYLVAVHPAGWRNIDGAYKTTQNLLKSKQITYLEIHNEKDGQKTFGATTRYDFYCLQNVPCSVNTKIKCEDGTIERVDISKMEFIPNGMFKTYQKLLPKRDEENVEVLQNCAYHAQKSSVSKIKTEEHKFPCIHSVKSGDVLNLQYSTSNTLGHFGVPKLVWSSFAAQSAGSYIDDGGEYGMTQFSYGIVDEVEKLPYIKRAFDSKEFRNLMIACSTSVARINPKIVATFRKDFWMDFI